MQIYEGHGILSGKQESQLEAPLSEGQEVDGIGAKSCNSFKYVLGAWYEPVQQNRKKHHEPETQSKLLKENLLAENIDVAEQQVSPCRRVPSRTGNSVNHVQVFRE